MQGNKLITILTLALLTIALFISIIFYGYMLNRLPGIAYLFVLFWLTASIIFTGLSFGHFVSYFLISLFCMMIAWRIAGIYEVYTLVYLLFAVFICFFINFIYCMRANMRTQSTISLAEWQLIFIRIYIGLDFIPHFTEKLFAGYGPHMTDVTAFMQLKVPSADFFVWIAGICEFGAAIALALGFMMRLGGLGAVIYLAIATQLGRHFSLGFIWAGPGGGWEFATMWMVIILTFTISGFNTFSIDEELQKRYHFPKWLRKCM